jgi:hypothetical protein
MRFLMNPARKKNRFDIGGFVLSTAVFAALAHYGLGFGDKATFVVSVSSAFFLNFNDEPV